jgi:hypothetical protein
VTHKPAVPAASTPPYPLHPLPVALRPDADQAPDESEPKQDASAGKVGAMSAAIGIGSAAIVAALLYVHHRKG